MKVIGLTGGIACGKSTVAKILREMGVPVIDADQVSREIVEPGTPAIREIISRFGEDIVDENGKLFRKKLGAIIMSDTKAKKDLEGITHPRINNCILQKLNTLRENEIPIAVVEAAIMVENGSYKNYHGLVVVSCDPKTQLERLKNREKFNQVQAKKWIASQLPLSEKEEKADLVIHNNEDFGSLKRKVNEYWPSFVAALNK